MSNQTERKILLVILATFALLGILYSSLVPIFEASDELWHYPMVEHIARTWTLPVQPLAAGASSGPWRQEASQPPLYYAIGAALTFWIDTRDSASPYAMTPVRHLNPHVAAGEITPDGSNVNLVVHNPTLERFPWQGTALAVHIVRLFSVTLGTWAVYLTWALVHELYPQARKLALSAAAIHAFTPMYLFISSSVNNDNLIVPLCSLALLMMVRIVKGRTSEVPNPRSPISDLRSPIPHPPSPVLNPQRYILLGIVLGLGLLTKASAIGLLPLAAATIAWETWQNIKWQIGKSADQRISEKASQRLSIQHHSPFSHYASVTIRPATSVSLPPLAISGWWFYRNYQLYGEWLGLNAFYAVLGTRDVPADFAQLWAERFAFAAGYWGNFGGLNIPMPTWIYTALNTLAVLTLIKIAVHFGIWVTGQRSSEAASQRLSVSASSNQLPDPQSPIPHLQISNQKIFNLWPFTWDPLTAARALAWAWAAAVFVSWTTWATITWSSQGRLIFSAIPMWSLALALPMRHKSQVKSQKLPSASLRNLQSSIFDLQFFPLLLLCLIALPVWIMPAYAPPSATRREIANPYNVQFGNVLQLQGYTIEKRAIHPGETIGLTLYWKALQPTATDHSIFIHLLGENDRIIAQRDTFPGRGLVSTTWIQAGHIWAETYNIPTPPMAYAPDSMTFALGLYATASGARVPVTDATGAPLGETARFGDVWLAAKPGDVPNPIQMHFGKGMTLIGYDVSNTSAARGAQLEVTLHWACEAPIANDYTISVQLIDSQWRKAAQSDAWPLAGAAPTSSWQVGQTLEETRTLTVAPDAAPGVYDLQLTIYRMNDTGKLEHLPIVWQTGQMPAKTVVLTRVRVQ